MKKRTRDPSFVTYTSTTRTNIHTHKDILGVCIVIELIEGKGKEIDRLMRDTITKKTE